MLNRIWQVRYNVLVSLDPATLHPHCPRPNFHASCTKLDVPALHTPHLVVRNTKTPLATHLNAPSLWHPQPSRWPIQGVRRNPQSTVCMGNDPRGRMEQFLAGGSNAARIASVWPSLLPPLLLLRACPCYPPSARRHSVQQCPAGSTNTSRHLSPSWKCDRWPQRTESKNHAPPGRHSGECQSQQGTRGPLLDREWLPQHVLRRHAETWKVPRPGDGSRDGTHRISQDTG